MEFAKVCEFIPAVPADHTHEDTLDSIKIHEDTLDINIHEDTIKTNIHEDTQI